MEILEAYCVDYDCNMDIYEARDVFFDTPEGKKRKRFQFRCSDEACRAKENPLIVAVNYDKIVEKSEKYRQPYFRSHNVGSHLDMCIWKQGHGRNLQFKSANKRGNSGRSDSPKATNVIDVFNPRDDDAPRLMRKSVVDKKSTGTEIANASSNTTLYPKKTRKGYSKTSRLERFIDCWSRYSPKQRERHHITIEGRKLKYNQAVLRTTSITQKENGTRIIQGGGVKASYCSPNHRNSEMLHFEFRDKLNNFEPRGKQASKSLCIEFPKSRLKNYRGGALLETRINQSRKPWHYLKVYAFGTIKPRDPEKGGYVLELKSLDNLVFKAIRRKSST